MGAYDSYSTADLDAELAYRRIDSTGLSLDADKVAALEADDSVVGAEVNRAQRAGEVFQVPVGIDTIDSSALADPDLPFSPENPFKNALVNKI